MTFTDASISQYSPDRIGQLEKTQGVGDRHPALANPVGDLIHQGGNLASAGVVVTANIGPNVANIIQDGHLFDVDTQERRFSQLTLSGVNRNSGQIIVNAGALLLTRPEAGGGSGPLR